jgi:hypothetical protein
MEFLDKFLLLLFYKGLTYLHLEKEVLKLSVHIEHTPKTKYQIFRRMANPSILKDLRNKGFLFVSYKGRFQLLLKRSCLRVLRHYYHAKIC